MLNMHSPCHISLGFKYKHIFQTAFLPLLVWEVCLLKEMQSGHPATLVVTCACLRCLWRPANSGGLLFLQIIGKSYAEKTWRKKVRLFGKARPCIRQIGLPRSMQRSRPSTSGKGPISNLYFLVGCTLSIVFLVSLLRLLLSSQRVAPVTKCLEERCKMLSEPDLRGP